MKRRNDSRQAECEIVNEAYMKNASYRKSSKLKNCS
jgi:hypothetical protein